MKPLYADDGFTFRFGEDRLISRIHLEGVRCGCRVTVFSVNAKTGERLGLLATATVGKDGWADLPQPLIVRAGDAFIAVAEPEPAAEQ
jgi:hypothetical protein